MGCCGGGDQGAPRQQGGPVLPSGAVKQQPGRTPEMNTGLGGGYGYPPAPGPTPHVIEMSTMKSPPLVYQPGMGRERVMSAPQPNSSSAVDARQRAMTGVRPNAQYNPRTLEELRRGTKHEPHYDIVPSKADLASGGISFSIGGLPMPPDSAARSRLMSAPVNPQGLTAMSTPRGRYKSTR